MTATELHPIFADCCAKEKTRYAITVPFQCGDYICATDGRILIRMKGRIEETDIDTPIPPANDIFTEWKGSGDFATLPTPEPTMTKCPECDGSGTARKDCEECDGTGQVECSHCGGEYDCEECDGKGYIGNENEKCQLCNGDKVVVNDTALVDLGDAGLSYGYVAMLLKHGVRQVELAEQKAKRPVRFCIGDIEGMLIPRSKN